VRFLAARIDELRKYGAKYPSTGVRRFWAILELLVANRRRRETAKKTGKTAKNLKKTLDIPTPTPTMGGMKLKTQFRQANHLCGPGRLLRKETALVFRRH